MLPDDVQFVVLEHRGLRVRNVRFAVLLDVDSTRGTDPLGPSQAQHPADGVQHMNAHIAHDAVAVLHERPPPADVRQAVVGPQRSRAGPHFVIEKVRHGLDGRISVGPHVIVATDVDVRDLSQQAGIDDVLFGIDQVRRALALRADLDHAAQFTGRRQHGFALEDVHADRLLDVHIRPGLHRIQCVQGMPMVRAADEHDIQVLFLEHLAMIAVGAGHFLGFLPLADQLGCFGPQLLVGIAQRDDVDRCNLDQAEQVVLAVPAGTDQSDSFRPLRGDFDRFGSPQDLARTGQRAQGCSSLLKKSASVHGIGLLGVVGFSLFCLLWRRPFVNGRAEAWGACRSRRDGDLPRAGRFGISVAGTLRVPTTTLEVEYGGGVTP